MSNIKLKQTDDTGSVTLKAGSSGSNDVELTLPTAIGSNDQYLKLSGVSGQTGALSFATVSSPITALNNATANELVTVGSTTTELDAEAGLTFDGTHLSITDGDLKVATAGHGIDFSAVSHAGGMTSELLDWYEEGTFTPTIEDWGSETAGNQSMGSENGGKYTRIGNIVFIQIAAHQTSSSSSAGNRAGFYVGGLPFSQDTTTFGCAWSVTTSGVTADGDHQALIGMQQASSQKFRIYNRDYDSNSSGWPDLPTGAVYLHATFHYRCS